VDTCTGCGNCKDICSFLTEFGTPDEILTGRPEASFYCTFCRRCEPVCPLNLSPGEAFFETKARLIREGRMPQPVQKALDGARGFAGAGHKFPFCFYDCKETVFWPGCGLSANHPGLVRKVCDILSRDIGRKVGLVLDCCFDPVYSLGDTDTAAYVLEEIKKHLHKGGVRKVVTGCLNCHKLLSGHLGDIEVIFILEALPAAAFKLQKQESIYLHHPCPSARWEAVRDAARKIAGPIYSPPSPRSALEQVGQSAPLCCGAGGSLTSISSERADRFLSSIIKDAGGKTILTYCTGCQNLFLKAGEQAIHLLECLEEARPRRNIPAPPRQWFNRLMLAAQLRMRSPKGLIFLAIALLIAGGMYLNSQHIFSTESLTHLLARHPVLAPVLFLALYAVAPSLFLPSIPLTLAAGFFWGPVWGVVLSIAGATLGACVPFFLSRYLLQNAVKNKIPPERWQWLQDKVHQHGWKAVAFTRLIPVFPFNLLNYLFGLTPIAFIQYLWSTFIFMLPACIAFVAFGSSLGELILHGNIKGVIIGIGIAVCAFLIPLALRPFFRKVGDLKKDGKEI